MVKASLKLVFFMTVLVIASCLAQEVEPADTVPDCRTPSDCIPRCGGCKYTTCDAGRCRCGCNNDNKKFKPLDTTPACTTPSDCNVRCGGCKYNACDAAGNCHCGCAKTNQYREPPQCIKATDCISLCNGCLANKCVVGRCECGCAK